MMKRTILSTAWSRAVLSLAALCLAAACEQPAQPIHPGEAGPVATTGPWPRNDAYGFVVGGAATQAEANAMMNRAYNAGVGWVKVTLYWHHLQQAPGGAFDSAQIASVRHQVRAARERGLKVVAMLEGFPGFSRGCGKPGTLYYGRFDPTSFSADVATCDSSWRYPPDDGLYNTLQMYLAAVMDQWFASYPYDVQVYSVGNEFNNGDFFRVLSSKYLPSYSGPDRDEVAEYCKVVNYVGGEARARGKHVIAGELAIAHNPDGVPAGSPYQWLRRVLQTCGSSFDIVGVHSYHGGSVLDLQMSLFQQEINTYGPGKPLWLTEVGSTNDELGHPQSNTAADSALAVHIATIFHEQSGGRPATWAKSFYFRLDGPIAPDLAHSYLTTRTATGDSIVRPRAYNCVWWYALGNTPQYFPTPRPQNCVPK
jgi:hypothetical protein